ncbi:hypothetical protein LSH36_1337g00005 [Paralvinella palmiformis]|uniref:Uncharacterized protein n=1 Tax=Paralvinella palmiformis TaxID=53620 RepID=A0AAD9ITM3_9ANNE|nr:hypothetical protein LSH36_1337g00005 [Paralvinella palmiformis]
MPTFAWLRLNAPSSVQQEHPAEWDMSTIAMTGFNSLNGLIAKSGQTVAGAAVRTSGEVNPRSIQTPIRRTGLFILIASIFFMTQLMQVEGLKPTNIGWAAWLALSSAIVIIFQHGIISLFFYVLKRPNLEHPSSGDRTHDDDVYTSEGIDDKELERIQNWILEQGRGVDNPSFESDCPSNGRRQRSPQD